MPNLLWLQGGACSGNTMSFLNAEEPSACDLVTDFGINILWHPSLGMELGDNLQKMLKALISGALPLDIFVFEGTVVNAPNGTGEWNRFAGRPMKDWVADLAKVAGYTVAIGDCATWGGIPATAPNPSDSPGLQFLKRAHGGFLGKDYSRKRACRSSTCRAAPLIPTGSRRSWSRWRRGAAAICRSTSSSGPKRSSPASRRPAAPATCTSPTRSRRPSSASAKVVCSTISAAAGR